MGAFQICYLHKLLIFVFMFIKIYKTLLGSVNRLLMSNVSTEMLMSNVSTEMDFMRSRLGYFIFFLTFISKILSLGFLIFRLDQIYHGTGISTTSLSLFSQ